MKFEYQIIDLAFASTKEESATRLCFLGKQGWEVVGVTSNGTTDRVYLKRQGGGEMSVEILESRAERILDAIEDHVAFELNPSDEECSECGGEGYTYDCFDGCCIDAESGCEQCARRCVGCASYQHLFLRGVRVEVLKALSVELSMAWLKKHAPSRWREDITPREVLLNIHAARTGCGAFTSDERGDSACWVECLL